MEGLKSIRTDKLLLGLGGRLSEANALIFNALDVWQKLVDLEKKLKDTEDEQRTRAELGHSVSVLDYQTQVNGLKRECAEAAHFLRQHYSQIKQRLPSVPEELAIAFERLEEDYKS